MRFVNVPARGGCCLAGLGHERRIAQMARRRARDEKWPVNMPAISMLVFPLLVQASGGELVYVPFLEHA